MLRLYGLKSLKQATRQNWPWWTVAGPDPDRATDGREWSQPILPDFRADDTAALQLLVKLSCSTEYLRVFPPSAPGEPWSAEDKGAMPGEGETLGACVLNMLERYQDVPW